jgi:hypothetical protein
MSDACRRRFDAALESLREFGDSACSMYQLTSSSADTRGAQGDRPMEWREYSKRRARGGSTSERRNAWSSRYIAPDRFLADDGVPGGRGRKVLPADDRFLSIPVAKARSSIRSGTAGFRQFDTRCSCRNLLVAPGSVLRRTNDRREQTARLPRTLSPTCYVMARSVVSQMLLTAPSDLTIGAIRQVDIEWRDLRRRGDLAKVSLLQQSSQIAQLAPHVEPRDSGCCATRSHCRSPFRSPRPMRVSYISRSPTLGGASTRLSTIQILRPRL